jgi:hypothetical protein
VDSKTKGSAGDAVNEPAALEILHIVETKARTITAIKRCIFKFMQETFYQSTNEKCDS